MRLLAAVLYVKRELAPFGLYVGSSRLMTERHIDSIAMARYMESSVITVSSIYTSTSGISSLAGVGTSVFAGCGTSALELYVRRELTCPKPIASGSSLSLTLDSFIDFINHLDINRRRLGRVGYGASLRLENCWWSYPRGFESHSRQIFCFSPILNPPGPFSLEIMFSRMIRIF